MVCSSSCNNLFNLQREWRTQNSKCWGAVFAHELEAAQQVQQRGGALKEHHNGCPKQHHLVAVQPEAAAHQAQGMVKQERGTADSAVEQQCEGSVVQQVAVHEAAPEELLICNHEPEISCTVGMCCRCCN